MVNDRAPSGGSGHGLKPYTDEGARVLADCPRCGQAGRVRRIGSDGIASFDCFGKCDPGLGYAVAGAGPYRPLRVVSGRHDSATARGSTWEPVDLTEIVGGDYAEPPPELLLRADGVALFYRGRVHLVSGQPECGKGWFALCATAERLMRSEDVLYADFEDSAVAIVARLLALGVPSEPIVDHFHYVRPDEPIVSLDRLLALEPSLAVLDGLTEALTIHGLNLLDNSDVARWLALLPRPLQHAGAAVVQIDHVTKAKDGRDRYSIGAQHKLAGVDVAYALEVVETFSRGRNGTVRVLVHKDRPGHVRQHARDKCIADFRLISSEDGGVRCELHPPEEREPFRPTGYMAKVSRELEATPGLSKREIRAAVGGKSDYIDAAVRLLLAEGFVRAERDGRASRHHVITPFTTLDGAQPCPDRAQGTSVRDRALVPHPSKGGTGTGTSAAPSQRPDCGALLRKPGKGTP